MREILFRGKRLSIGTMSVTTTDEWVYGYLVKDTINTYIYCPYEGRKMVNVDPETVGQYTGLKDTNGKKIFEGDIVRCHKRGAVFWRCKVVWNQIKARFDVITMKCAFPMYIYDNENDIFINGLDYEVIGNIHDNAELLEVNDNEML